MHAHRHQMIGVGCIFNSHSRFLSLSFSVSLFSFTIHRSEVYFYQTKKMHIYAYQYDEKKKVFLCLFILFSLTRHSGYRNVEFSPVSSFPMCTYIDDLRCLSFSLYFITHHFFLHVTNSLYCIAIDNQLLLLTTITLQVRFILLTCFIFIFFV